MQQYQQSNKKATFFFQFQNKKITELFSCKNQFMPDEQV